MAKTTNRTMLTHDLTAARVYARDHTITQKNPEDPSLDPDLSALMQMLTYCRVGESAQETEFICRYILPLGPTLIDQAGNIHFDLRQDNENTTLFTAHTDTVHHTPGRQSVFFDQTEQVIHTDGECLGADDATGVAILCHLITQKVPAYYIFTRGEESGGIGAEHLVRNFEELLSEFDRAVAFDRKDTFSVITHQRGRRCCSDKFAKALYDSLNDQGLMYMDDDTGSYTDTAEFMDLIPECTNISVGYMHEHTGRERLHWDHFKALAHAVLQIHWDNLPVSRDPTSRGGYADLLLNDDDIYGAGFFHPVPSAEEEADEVRVFLRFACTGHEEDLLWLIADRVYPEDPDLAYDRLLPGRLTQQMLDQALEQLDWMEPWAVLFSLYEELSTGSGPAIREVRQ